jgi:hypothetical protein
MMMMMMIKMVLEMSVQYRHLTRLIAREDFIEAFQLLSVEGKEQVSVEVMLKTPSSNLGRVTGHFY